MKKILKKFYYYIFILTILYSFYSFILIFTTIRNVNDVLIDPSSRILFVIPYIIYNNCISNEYSRKFNFNFTKKDWILFVLIIFIRFIYMAFTLFFETIPGFGFLNYFIINYFRCLLIIIILSLLMKFVSKFNFYIHHITSLGISSLIIIMLMISLIYNVNFEFFPPPSLAILVIIFFLNLILISISLIYCKYLMDKKNISFYLVCFFYGLVDLSSAIISIIIFNNTSIFKYSFGVINFKKILVKLYLLIFYSIFNYIYYRTISELSVIYGEIFTIQYRFMNSIMNILTYLNFFLIISTNI